MKKWMVITVMMIWTIGLVVQLEAREKHYQYSNYQEMRAEAGRLYQQQKFKEMASLLEWGFEKFPDHLEANSFNLMLVYGQIKQWRRGIGIMKKALQKNIPSSLPFTAVGKTWNSLFPAGHRKNSEKPLSWPIPSHPRSSA